MRQLKILVLILLIGFASNLLTEVGYAQNYELIRRQLQEKQNKTRSEIENLKYQISTYQTQATKAAQEFERLQAEYQSLEKEIVLRNEVIKKLKNESEALQSEISVTQKEFNRQEKNLQRLIENYKATLRYVYIHGRTSDLALLLTSTSFNQMLARSYYLTKFEEFRTKQATEIDEAKKELKSRENDLKLAKEKNKLLIEEEEIERLKLADKIKEQEVIIAKLRKDRRRIASLITKTDEEINNMNSTLENLIAEEISVRKAEEERLKKLEEERLRRLAEAQKIEDVTRRKTEIARYENPIRSTAGKTLNEKEIADIESSFRTLKGKLPWPVENGVISAKFGNKVHPVYKTKVMNNGIEIATEARCNVYAIHDGIVLGVVPIPGYGDVIIVNHGVYNTVYGNLSEVYARKNMIIKAGDIIALGGDENSPKGTSVFLMIRENKENLNPETWIVTR